MKDWCNIISVQYVDFIAMVDHLLDVQQSIDVTNTVFKVRVLGVVESDRYDVKNGRQTSLKFF